ncbi:MAG: ATP-dependent zinc protease [Gammaproteobacteria bacterium]|nr:ATP-dependent zinc protease [Gammaproteobacteria bacterium]
MKSIFFFSQFLLILLLSATAAHAEHNGNVVVAGWLERITLAPWQFSLRAKLDTGAKTSSIHAEHVERFTRDEQQWLRFILHTEDNKAHTVEAPLARDVSIKRHHTESVTRPVVKLGFCLNAHFYTTEFTLADRGNYNYPVLLGRRFLEKKVLVDPGSIFKYSPREKLVNCQPDPEKLNIKVINEQPQHETTKNKS